MALKSAHKWSLGSAVGLIGSIVAIWATGIWSVVGWTTPNQHNASIVAIHDQRTIVAGELKDFRDEWKCDEYDEELLDLREQLLDVTSDHERAAIEHEIEKLKEKMARIDCSRFEDFG